MGNQASSTNTMMSTSVDFLHRLNDQFTSAGMVSIIALVVVTLGSAWLLLYLKIKGRGSSEERLPLPPGSWGLPFLGDSLKFIDAFHNVTIKSYFEEKVRKYGTIFKASVTGEKYVFLDTPAGPKFCFSHESVLDGYWPRSIADLAGPHSLGAKKNGEVFKTQKNHWMNSFFGVDVLPRYTPTMEKISVAHLRKHWLDTEAGAQIKTEEVLSLFTFGLIAELCAGITDEAEVKKLREDYHIFAAGAMAVPINLPGLMFHRAHQAKQRILQTLTREVGKRKKELEQGLATPTQDLMAVLLTHPDQTGRIYSEDEVAGNLLPILWGGFDTTLSTLTSIMWHIAKNPNVYEELRQEHDIISSKKADDESLTKEDVRSMKYTWRVIQETLRILPTVQSIYREAKETLEYNGYTIPKGWKLVLSAAQYRNPQKFDRPDVFDPSRFEKGSGGGAAPYTFFPFGGGSRLCPGYEFAKISMLVFLHCLVKHVKWSVVDVNEKITYNPFPSWQKHMLTTIEKRESL